MLKPSWAARLEAEKLNPAALMKDIRAKLQPTAVDQAGRSLIHYAVLADAPTVLTALADWGAPVSLQDTQGSTPLHIAADRQATELIERLLAAGASVEARDAWGNTPLFKAAFRCNGVDGSPILALLAAGANPDAENQHGVSPRKLGATIANVDVKRFFAGQ